MNFPNGVLVGHQSLGDTGCTVIITPDSAICAVDVRGGGPGTRETDLLRPENTVQRVHGLTFSGGSAYGLAVADGVLTLLEKTGIGFPVLGENVPGPIVPIVPGAVIFDLLVGDASHRPTAADGLAAAQSALGKSGDYKRGSVGAGCGATAGVVRGGYGESSTKVGKYHMAAGIVANPVGSVVDPTTGQLWHRPDITVDLTRYLALQPPSAQLNTTIGFIATDAPISKAQAKRLAMVGHDGIARAIRPAHSPLDGDTLFCLSTGNGTGVELPELIALSEAAAEIVANAIIDAVLSATTGYNIPALSELIDAQPSTLGPL